MKGNTLALFGFTTLLTMILSGCGSSGGGSVSENRSNRGYNPGVGPFDSRGNYVERWANDKSKGRWWRKGSSKKPSAIAASEPTKPSPTPPPLIASHTTPTPRTVARTSSPRPRAPVRGSATPRPKPRPTVATRSKPRPKPKPTVRVKPKRKAPIRYTIKKGDTLYGISRRYKASVTAIQRANGMKGTNLKIGRRLLIPR